MKLSVYIERVNGKQGVLGYISAAGIALLLVFYALLLVPNLTELWQVVLVVIGVLTALVVTDYIVFYVRTVRLERAILKAAHDLYLSSQEFVRSADRLNKAVRPDRDGS